MNDFFPKLADRAKEEAHGLTPLEKSAMLARIRAEMKAHPAVAPATHFSAPRFVSPVRSPFEFLLLRGVLIPLIAVFAFVGGLSAYAAEGAVPGDLLYPIKVSVTEPVREVLAFSAEAKAAWHAEAVERRMREAETLALRGELTASNTAEIEARFDQHISMVEAFLRAVESNSPLAAAEISAKFAGMLAAYGSNIVQAGLKSVDVVTRRESDSLAEHIKDKKARLVSPDSARAVSAPVPARTKRPSSQAAPTHVVSFIDVTLSNTLPVLPVLQDLEGQVLSALGRMESEYRSLRPVIGSDASLEAEKRVADIRELLVAAVAAQESADEKKKARLELALKHAAGLELFLRERAKGAAVSAATATSTSELPVPEKEEDGKAKEKDLLPTRIIVPPAVPPVIVPSVPGL